MPDSPTLLCLIVIYSANVFEWLLPVNNIQVVSSCLPVSSIFLVVSIESQRHFSMPTLVIMTYGLKISTLNHDAAFVFCLHFNNHNLKILQQID